MKNYKVFDVGDALSSLYIGDDDSKSVFDFGSSNKNEFQKIHHSEYDCAETFVISHFHSDHYNNFTFCQNNSLTIDKLIIPKLPDDTVIQDSMKAFMTIQLYYLGEKTGFYEYDLLNLIREKNQKDFSVIRVCKNDTFKASNHDFGVLWPDFNYLARLKSINKALKDFNEVTSKNDLFRKFHDQVKDSGFWKIEYVTLSEKLNDFRIELTEKQKELLESANKSLTRLANDICLAFESKKNELLFLGDLSTRALNSLFKSDFKLNKVCDVVLSAHHGTHSSIHPNWKNIKTCVMVTSGGEQRLRKFKSDYFYWSNRQHHTHCHHTFESIPYLRYCKLKNLNQNNEHQRT